MGRNGFAAWLTGQVRPLGPLRSELAGDVGLPPRVYGVLVAWTLVWFGVAVAAVGALPRGGWPFGVAVLVIGLGAAGVLGWGLRQYERDAAHLLRDVSALLDADE